MLSIRADKVTLVVDAAVGFVRELNNVLGRKGLPLDWMYSRQSEAGIFPPQAFE